MDRIIVPDVVVGNEFIVRRPQLRPAAAAPVAMQSVSVPVARPTLDSVEFGFEEVPIEPQSRWQHTLNHIYTYSVGVAAVLLLMIGTAAIQVVGNYQSAQIAIDNTDKKQGLTRILTQPKKGPNMAVLTTQSPERLAQIAGQPINLTLGTKQVPIGADTVKSWVKAVENKAQGVTYLHVSEASVAKSLQELAAANFKAPLDQVVVPQADGSSRVIAPGRNGSKVGDTAPIAKDIATNLFAAKGFQFNVPVEPVNFAVVTPANFEKMIEVNLSTKQMYAYQKGQLVNSWPISAGAPETPTPVGQYKIYAKLTSQDMRGLNADGTPYFQPKVKYVNYFLSGGYAIHGNYWRPQSWFGAINSSHGCVSLPDAQAKWVYDWAPIGTTVITHH